MTDPTARALHGTWLMGNQSMGVMSLTRDSMGEFKPQYGVELPPDLYRPYTSRTVEEGYKDNATRLADIVADYLANTDTWHFKMMPLLRTDLMVLEWVKYQSNHTSLDAVSEKVPPRYIQLAKSRHAVRLGHYSQGFELNEEFLMTPEGSEDMRRLENLLRQNTLATMQQIVAETVFNGLLYFQQHERLYGRRFNGLLDVIAREVEDFCPLSIDDKGILKIMTKERQRFYGYRDPPNLNMMVVPSNTKGFLAFGKGAEWHLEASRRGDAGVQDIVTRGAEAFATIEGLPVYEDQPVIDTKRADVVDAFRRTAVTGTMAVLDGDAEGKPDAAGVAEPEIQLITMPRDDWQTFKFSQLLDHCARFDHVTGRLNMQALYDLANSVRDIAAENSEWTEYATYPDPFLTFSNPRAGGDGSYMVVNYMGDQDTHWRPTSWDKDFGIKACRQSMTREEIVTINDFMYAVKQVYERSPGDDDAADLTQDRGYYRDNVRNQQWGGPVYPTDYPADRYPFMAGSIPGLMSYIQAVPSANRPAGLKDLVFDTVDKALNKLYEVAKRLFEGMPLLDARNCPEQFRTNSSKTNAKIGTLVGLLDHTKYPLFVSIGTGSQQSLVVNEWQRVITIGGDRGTIATISSPSLRAFKDDQQPEKADELYQAARRAIGAKDKLTLNELIRDFEVDGDEFIKLNNLLSNLVPLLLNAPPKTDWRGEIKIDDNLLNALANQGGASQRDETVAQDVSEWRISPGVASPDTIDALYTQSGTNVLPADPQRPDRFLSADSSADAVAIARAPMPRSNLDSNVPTMTDVESGNAYFTQKGPHFVLPQFANDPTGPYVGLTVDGKTIADRYFNLLRQKEVSEISDACSAFFTKAMLMTPFSKKALKNFLRHSLPVPMNLMIANPFIRTRTDAMILAEGGAELGQLGFNLPHTGEGYDNHIKVRERHFTIFMAGVLKDNAKLIVKPDAKFAGYEGGLSDRFIDTPEQYPTPYDGVGSENFKGSMLVFDLPISENRDEILAQASPCFLFGRPNEDMFDYQYTQDKEQILAPEKPSFSTQPFYKLHFNLDRINDGRYYQGGTYMELRESEYVPGVLLHRATRAYNPRSGRYEMDYHGKAHIDRCGHPPIKPTLDGEITFGDQRPFA
jgi:hypothetical protein